jgi:FKBP-type peptidyl-prolyl cis-trans isomerase
MRNRLVGLFIILVAAGFSSCEKENPIEKQEERIEAYIRTKMSRNPALKLSKSGDVYYLYVPGDTTVRVAVGDSVYLYYTGTFVTDTMRYFDTNDRAKADAKLNTDDRKFEPLGVVVGDGNLLEGLGTGLNMVHPNDRGEIIFNSDLGFGKKGNGIIPSLSALIFKVHIIRIKKLKDKN